MEGVGGCWLAVAGGEFWSDLIWSSVIYQRDLDLAWLTNILQSSITTITTRLSGQDLWDMIGKWLEHYITYFSLTFIILRLKTQSIKIPQPLTHYSCESHTRSKKSLNESAIEDSSLLTHELSCFWKVFLLAAVNIEKLAIVGGWLCLNIGVWRSVQVQVHCPADHPAISPHHHHHTPDLNISATHLWRLIWGWLMCLAHLSPLSSLLSDRWHWDWRKAKIHPNFPAESLTGQWVWPTNYIPGKILSI